MLQLAIGDWTISCALCAPMSNHAPISNLESRLDTTVQISNLKSPISLSCSVCFVMQCVVEIGDLQTNANMFTNSPPQEPAGRPLGEPPEARQRHEKTQIIILLDIGELQTNANMLTNSTAQQPTGAPRRAHGGPLEAQKNMNKIF